MEKMFDAPGSDNSNPEIPIEEKARLVEEYKGFYGIDTEEKLQDYIEGLRGVAEKLGLSAEFQSILENRLEPARNVPLGPDTDEKYFKPAGLAMGVYNDFRAVVLHEPSQAASPEEPAA